MTTLQTVRSFALGAALFGAAAASGHARLLGTSPASGAELAAAPPSLTLSFNESVRLATLTLISGGAQTVLPVDRDAAPAAAATVRLPSLAPGRYEVRWSALTVSDGHAIKGAFSFLIR